MPLMQVAERAVRGFRGTLTAEGYDLPVAILEAHDVGLPGDDRGERYSFRVETTGPPVARKPTADTLKLFAAAATRYSETLDLLDRCGSIEGEEHARWCLDQVVRLMTGDRYAQWVADHRRGDDGPDAYPWDVGVEP